MQHQDNDSFACNAVPLGSSASYGQPHLSCGGSSTPKDGLPLPLPLPLPPVLALAPPMSLPVPLQ